MTQRENLATRGLLSILLAPFLFADCLRILLYFAAFCRAKLLKLFGISVGWPTDNPLVGGSNPSGPTRILLRHLVREVPRFARDFACGLKRPQSGSSSNPSGPTTVPLRPFARLHLVRSLLLWWQLPVDIQFASRSYEDQAIGDGRQGELDRRPCRIAAARLTAVVQLGL